MRFMMLIYPNVAGENWSPSVEAVAAMSEFNSQLQRSGALLALDGLHAADRGAVVSWPQGQAVVAEGPFAGVRETVGGYWIIEAGSREEAVAWARQIPPVSAGQTVEVRQIQEMEDFPVEVREAASFKS